MNRFTKGKGNTPPKHRRSLLWLLLNFTIRLLCVARSFVTETIKSRCWRMKYYRNKQKGITFFDFRYNEPEQKSEIKDEKFKEKV